MSSVKHDYITGVDKRPALSSIVESAIVFNEADGSIWTKGVDDDLNDCVFQLGGPGLSKAWGNFYVAGDNSIDIRTSHRINISFIDVGKYKVSFKNNSKPKDGNYAVISQITTSDDNILPFSSIRNRNSDSFDIYVKDSSGNFINSVRVDFVVFDTCIKNCT